MKIIADIGSNWRVSNVMHENLLNTIVLMEQLHNVGVDIVKFQFWDTETFIHKDHPNYDTYKRLEVPVDWYEKLIKEAKRIGIDFMSTTFDFKITDMVHKLGQRRWKISSGDANFIPLIEKIAKYKEPIYISTGNCNEYEIQDAVNIIKTESYNIPITILHCISKYPTKFDEIGFKRITHLIRKYPYCDIGWSSHLQGEEAKYAALLALAMGVKTLEVHVKPKDVDTPDNFALTIDEISDLIQLIETADNQLNLNPEINETSLLWDRRNNKDWKRPWLETECVRD